MIFNPAHQVRSFWPCFHEVVSGCRTAIEFGCGNGNNLRQTRAIVKIGVEVVPDYPVKNGDDILFFIGDALDYASKYADQSFDLVLLIDVLEHFEKEKGWALLRECRRICADRILLWMPEGECPQNHELYGKGQHDYPYAPSQDHLSRWYTTDLESVGFNVARWENYHWNRQTNAQTVPALFAVWRRSWKPE